ncbi:MAG: hypothetical protein U0822_25420 [Anaerolineae bacterium]
MHVQRRHRRPLPEAHHWFPPPLLDRIDIHIDIPRVDYDHLLGDCLARAVPEDTLSPEHNGSRLHKSDADTGRADVREYCKLGNAFICGWL